VGELLEALQAAAEEHGYDARLVLDDGQRYGANYGGVSTMRDLLVQVEADEEEDF